MGRVWLFAVAVVLIVAVATMAFKHLMMHRDVAEGDDGEDNGEDDREDDEGAEGTGGGEATQYTDTK